MDGDAVTALLSLSTPPRVSVRAVSKGSPPLLKLTGVKRTTSSTTDITYETPSGRRCRIALEDDEDDMVFVERRCKAAHALHDPTRADVFCTWKEKVVNVPITGPMFARFHESVQQKRDSVRDVIQLVQTRHTCVQWNNRGDGNLCRSCRNPQFRASCLTPTYLHHLLPMPGFKTRVSTCDAALAALDPIDMPIDTAKWANRLPQGYVR